MHDAVSREMVLQNISQADAANEIVFSLPNKFWDGTKAIARFELSGSNFSLTAQPRLEVSTCADEKEKGSCQKNLNQEIR